MMQARLSPLILVAVLAIVSCDKTNHSPSIYRKEGNPKDVLVTDAKQRVIVFNTEKSKKDHKIVCAEPSPDVAQAFSEALTATVKDASFAKSFSSSIAQLGERMAVVQLFRDRMYRACEAFANGAIDETTYTLMSARIDKTMVTLLTAEMAAGAFGRALARTGGSAGTSVAGHEERAAWQKKIIQIIRLTEKLVNITKSDDDNENRADRITAIAKELNEAHEELLKFDPSAAWQKKITQIIRLTEKLVNITKSDDDNENRADRITAIAKELNEAHEELLKFDPPAVHVAASSGIDVRRLNIENEMKGADVPALKRELSDIHRTFFDDPGLEPLIDACLASVNQLRLDNKTAARLATLRLDIKSIQTQVENYEKKITSLTTHSAKSLKKKFPNIPEENIRPAIKLTQTKLMDIENYREGKTTSLAKSLKKKFPKIPEEDIRPAIKLIQPKLLDIENYGEGKTTSLDESLKKKFPNIPEENIRPAIKLIQPKLLDIENYREGKTTSLDESLKKKFPNTSEEDIKEIRKEMIMSNAKISLVKEGKKDEEDSIRKLEDEITTIYFEKKATEFTRFCREKILSNLSKNGFIKTMINSRYNLRKLDLESKRLAVCQMMLKRELKDDLKTIVIKSCTSGPTRTP